MSKNESQPVYRGEQGSDKSFVFSDDVRLPTRVILGSDQSTTSTTLVDCTGLSFPVKAGTRYHVEHFLQYQTALNTTGIGVGWNGPAFTEFVYHHSTYVLATTTANRSGRAFGSTSNSTGVETANAMVPMHGWALILPSAAGVLQLQFQSEVGGSAVTIKAGSYMRWYTL